MSRTSSWSASAPEQPVFFASIDWIDSINRSSKWRSVMHPISHLFQDIYRNYWGISPATDRP
ncbi:MAG: hypothetical protein E5V92_33525, partial [Mesorhizobium sp.]